MMNCFYKHFPFTADELYDLLTCHVTWNAVLPSFEASVTYEKLFASSQPKNENFILACVCVCVYIYIYIYILYTQYPHFLYLTYSKVFFFSTGATTHCGFVFYNPLAGYSFLAYEVS